MASKAETKSKERHNFLRDCVDKAKQFEEDKEYSTLQLAKYLYDVKENDAQVVENFERGIEGFKAFCGNYLRTGYHTAMRYIAIHKMAVYCAIDPAAAEDLGYSKLRTIAPVAKPDNINMLLEQAKMLSTHDLEEWVKKYKLSENPHTTTGEDPLPLFKKFTFSASEEEVPIINEALSEVKTIIGRNNDTAALVHICQAYSEFVLPHERDKALEEIKKPKEEDKKKTEKPKTEKKKETEKEPAPEKPTSKQEEKKAEAPEADTGETGADIISEDNIHKATLSELIAFAGHHDISIDPKIKKDQKKVKARIIDVLADRALEEESEEVTEEIAPPAKEEKKLEAKEDDKKTKPKSEPKPKEDKKPKTSKAEAEPEPVVEDPADKEGEGEAVSIEEAIAEVRACKTVEKLAEVAESYGVDWEEDDTVELADMVEAVVKELCKEAGVDYIPPQKKGKKGKGAVDIDNMLKGK